MLLGIIPAAGQGSRMKGLPFSKELLPVDLEKYQTSIDSLIDSFQIAKVNASVVVLNKTKIDIYNHLSKRHDDAIFFRSVKTLSLAHSILSCLELTEPHRNGGDVLFGLPDTVWSPNAAFLNVLQVHKDKSYDITFGLFNSQPSEDFDSVEIVGTEVKSILVKQDPPLSNWFWGIGAITFDAYTFLARQIDDYVKKSKSQEFLFGWYVSQLIEEKKIKVGGVKLSENTYFDLGTPERYKSFLANNK